MTVIIDRQFDALRRYNAIAEDEFYPVLIGGFNSGPPLRPGYIWQQERGRFFSAKSVPSEWEAGKATAKVTAIEFSDEVLQ